MINKKLKKINYFLNYKILKYILCFLLFIFFFQSYFYFKFNTNFLELNKLFETFCNVNYTTFQNPESFFLNQNKTEENPFLLKVAKSITCKEASASLALLKAADLAHKTTEAAICASKTFYVEQDHFTEKNFPVNFFENFYLDILIEIKNQDFLAEYRKASDPGVTAAAVGATIYITNTSLSDMNYYTEKAYKTKIKIFKKISFFLNNNKFIAKSLNTNLFLDAFLTDKKIFFTTDLDSKVKLNKLNEIIYLTKHTLEIEKKSEEYYKLRKNFDKNSKDYNSILLTTAEARSLAIPMIRKIYILWAELNDTKYSLNLLKQEFHIRIFSESILTKSHYVFKNEKSVSTYLKLHNYKLESFETIQEKRTRIKTQAFDSFKK